MGVTFAKDFLRLRYIDVVPAEITGPRKPSAGPEPASGASWDPLYLPRELSITGSIRPLFWKAASVRYSRQTQRFRRCGNVIS